jgi:hypothetical protein
MEIIKCDFCGAEIVSAHHETSKSNVPSDKGWCELSGHKPICGRWKKDVCPNCVGKMN